MTRPVRLKSSVRKMIGTARRATAGFSLVEVVLAIGIIAFALVSIISLMSLGLQSSKSSTDDTNIALMTQSVISLLRTSSPVFTGTGIILTTSTGTVNVSL